MNPLKCQFSLPIDPASLPTAQQKGVRTMVVNGRPVAQHYVKAEVRRAMDRIRFETLKWAPPYPPEMLLKLRDKRVPWWFSVIFAWELPKSYPKRLHGMRKTTRPDVDNLLKGMQDALTETGRFWVDDSQVGLRSVYSRWNDDGESPRILITIEPANDWRLYLGR